MYLNKLLDNKVGIRVSGKSEYQRLYALCREWNLKMPNIDEKMKQNSFYVMLEKEQDIPTFHCFSQLRNTAGQRGILDAGCQMIVNSYDILLEYLREKFA